MVATDLFYDSLCKWLVITMKDNLYKLVLRYKWEICILSDECVYIFVYFYCHVYYEENIKTTYTFSKKLRRSFKKYTRTIPLFTYKESLTCHIRYQYCIYVQLSLLSFVSVCNCKPLQFTHFRFYQPFEDCRLAVESSY